jgi:uncharacterized protein
MGKQLTWFNEPRQWSTGDGALVRFTCAGRTDFWRHTEGTPPSHSGHIYGRHVDGDFAVETDLTATLGSRYDQVGLLLVSSERRWLKAGVELDDGALWLCAAQTREESDWSREPGASLPIRLRIWRQGITVRVATAENDNGWRVFRVLALPGQLFAGVYAAAPTGDGFPTTVRQLSIGDDGAPA